MQKIDLMIDGMSSSRTTKDLYKKKSNLFLSQGLWSIYLQSEKHLKFLPHADAYIFLLPTVVQTLLPAFLELVWISVSHFQLFASIEKERIRLFIEFSNVKVYFFLHFIKLFSNVSRVKMHFLNLKNCII